MRFTKGRIVPPEEIDPDKVVEKALQDTEQPALSKRQQALIDEGHIIDHPIDETMDDPVLSKTAEQHEADAERAVKKMVEENHRAEREAASSNSHSKTWKDVGYNR
jgi:hypothetical protein